VRSRNNSELKADILEGHISSALCHLGNISHRLGTQFSQGEIQEKMKDRADISDALARFADHLSANGIDMTQVKPVLGPSLKLNPAEERFASSTEYDLESFGNQLVTRTYRAPFVVPEQV